MNRIRTGFISYSNCFPVYYPFAAGMFKHPEISIVEGKPSELNRLLARQALDVSSVSSIEYANLASNYRILDGISLNSYGYVKSVLLISRRKIEELDGKKIGLTPASATSHALLKIILADHYKITPSYAVTDKLAAGTDALLLIGDDALRYKAGRGLHVYDLGQLWAEIYRQPVIFALWIVHGKFLREKDRIKPLITSLLKSLKYSKSHWQEFLAAAEKKYDGLGIDLEEYYGKLRFDFGRDKKDALLFFLEKAHSQNLCPKCRGLKFFNKI